MSYSKNHLYYSAAFLLIAFSLLFSGCSTGSENGNQQPSFDSGNIAPGGTYSQTFQEEGTVDYFCEIHAPDMQGQITVTSSAEDVERDTVTMSNEQFQPGNLSVTPNTEVVWINEENVDHTVVSRNPTTDDDGGGDY